MSRSAAYRGSGWVAWGCLARVFRVTPASRLIENLGHEYVSVLYNRLPLFHIDIEAPSCRCPIAMRHGCTLPRDIGVTHGRLILSIYQTDCSDLPDFYAFFFPPRNNVIRDVVIFQISSKLLFSLLLLIGVIPLSFQINQPTSNNDTRILSLLRGWAYSTHSELYSWALMLSAGKWFTYLFQSSLY